MENCNLITVLGWEYRFVKGINIITEKHNLKSILLIVFSDYSSMGKMQENKNSVAKLATENEIDFFEIILKYNDSIGNWKKLNDYFKKNNLTNVLLNLTTIPRETIWTLLFFLKKNNKEVEYVYFSPKDYNNGWLTKNHKEPRLLFKHSGVFQLEKKLALFVVTGFDESRLLQLIEYYEPAKLIIFNQSGEQYDNLNRNKSIQSKLELEIEKVEIDSYNVASSTLLLNEHAEKNNEFNIILASQGPKTSSISTYNCYLKSEKRIALAYVPARDFNNKYSKGINAKFVNGKIEF